MRKGTHISIFIETMRTMLIAFAITTIVLLALWQASEYGDNCITGYEETACQVTP